MMKIKNDKLNKGEKLHFRHVGSGFIVGEKTEGIPMGRKLTKAYVDQFNRTYVQINGSLEPVTPQHGYLGAE